MTSPVSRAGQATVRTWDPETWAGTAVRDDGSVFDFPPAAFARSGLERLRPGQRVRVETTAEGLVTLVTIATL